MPVLVRLLALCLTLFAPLPGLCATAPFDDKFRQLEELLPTPNSYRTASGAPGHAYWQQRADYVIRATLDEARRAITASEQITYHNRSPDSLAYLWLQLDQNGLRQDADQRRVLSAPSRQAWLSGSEDEALKFEDLRAIHAGREFDGGFKLTAVKASSGKPLPYVVNQTMLRIDLPVALAPGQSVTFNIDWSYRINDQKVLVERSGYEYFEDDKNAIFQIAQWFPRMAAYYDAVGWQHKQFLGSGEFTLEFGDYELYLTVPGDHVVAATGELQNPAAVLSAAQRERLARAKSSDTPLLVITPEEALAAEKGKATGMKTWHFKAANVRDVAWASSRKFIWDAQGLNSGGKRVMAMSYYPNEGNPLWQQYSTRAVVHAIEQYNKYSFDYPYPNAISVNGAVGGMEYPMISFNGGRPVKDKKTGERTYSKTTKYDLIGVIIHEVGHNYFPMIVNSDERQWTWMDEGLNSFLQYLAEQAWEEHFPSWNGEPRKIVDYMRSQNQVPIMTNSESLLQFTANAYDKPATALNILRETILGRELFDFAFKQYALRWKFKRPTPADFFRTMEDASGTDLDWFWRGWFYTTDAVDISIDGISEYGVSTKNPEVEKAWKKAQKAAQPISISDQRNKALPKKVDVDPALKDFYNRHDEFTVTNKDRNSYAEEQETLEPWERKLLEQHNMGKHLYLVDFSNLGGLVMPLILEIELKSGKKIIERVPAEVWRYAPHKISKVIITDEPMVGLVQDPYWETADIDTSNNAWPRKITPSRLELFKQDRDKNNLMKDLNTPLKTPEAKAEVRPEAK